MSSTQKITLAKGLKVRMLYAVFVPDSDFYPVARGGDADPIHFGELELRFALIGPPGGRSGPPGFHVRRKTGVISAP